MKNQQIRYEVDTCGGILYEHLKDVGTARDRFFKKRGMKPLAFGEQINADYRFRHQRNRALASGQTTVEGKDQ